MAPGPAGGVWSRGRIDLTPVCRGEGALQEMKVARLTVRRRTFAATLALVAALAIGAVGASGAQALTWHTSGTTTLSGTESETVASSEGTVNVSSKLLAAQVQFGCAATSVGTIGAGGGGTSTVALSKCAVSKPAHCELTQPAPLRANIQVMQVGGALFQKFTPASEGKFGMIELVGAECALAGNSAFLKGAFAGRELSTSMAASHSLSFTRGEGETWPEVALTFGGTAATVSGNLNQHLTGLLEGGGWQGSGGAWKVEAGLPFSTAESVFTLGGPIKFGYNLLGSSITFSCGEVGLKSPRLVPGGTESAEQLKFSACKVEKPTGCNLPGNSLTFGAVTGTLVQVNGKAYEVFTPVNESFGTMSFEGVSCTLGGLMISFKGSFAAALPESGVMKKAHRLEFSEAASKATGSSLHAGSSAMNISGSVEQEPSGPRVGVPWNIYN
jgi:hypothetical protein